VTFSLPNTGASVPTPASLPLIGAGLLAAIAVARGRRVF
jgi:hypothetical protein